MPKFLLENLGATDVAYSTFTGNDAAEKASEPLIALFFQVAADTYQRESGQPVGDKRQFETWLFATQFHLPPNIRWLGVRRSRSTTFEPATDYEFWLCFGHRVQMPRNTPVKRVSPGLYATLLADFQDKPMFDPTAIQQAWQTLVSLVKDCGLQTDDDRPCIEEHLQKVNDGGWGGMKVMLPIKPASLPQGIRHGLAGVV